ncbi:MAG: pentapeptide repeat-containing protein [Chloroflexota bacterium]
MRTLPQLIEKLRSPDNLVVVDAVEELRARGWLESGALAGINLGYVHLQNADLFRANLSGVDLRQADLRWANLSLANLGSARLARANLSQADFSQADLRGADLFKANLRKARHLTADLRGADLFKANLRKARHLTADQLAQTARLRGAIMQDGCHYDGCFDLPGDGDFFGSTGAEPERDAAPVPTGGQGDTRFLDADPDDPAARINLYVSSMDDFLRG